MSAAGAAGPWAFAGQAGSSLISGLLQMEMQKKQLKREREAEERARQDARFAQELQARQRFAEAPMQQAQAQAGTYNNLIGALRATI
jgi:hypothetical protein